MLVHEEAKDIDYKSRKERSNSVDTLKDSSQEVREIKENVAGIAKAIRNVSVAKTRVATDFLRTGMEDLKTSGNDSLEKAEKRIRLNPGRSIALAFGAGLLANFLFGRK